MKSLSKTIRNRFKSAVTGVGLLLALGIFSSPVQAQATGTTNIDIDFPPLIILYYFGEINIDITTAALAGIVTGGAGDTAIDEAGGGITATAFTDDVSIPGTTSFTSPASVNIDLLNAWGVRAIANAAGADVRVTVALTSGTLTDPVSSDTITINSVTTTSPSGAGAFAAFADITPAGLGTVIRGDVRLNVDLTGAGQEGNYDGGDFTITAASL